jgi:hypothetical protein
MDCKEIADHPCSSVIVAMSLVSMVAENYLGNVAMSGYFKTYHNIHDKKQASLLRMIAP